MVTATACSNRRRTRPGHCRANSGRLPPCNVSKYGLRARRSRKQVNSAQINAVPLKTPTCATVYSRRRRHTVNAISSTRSNRRGCPEVVNTNHPAAVNLAAKSSLMLRTPSRAERKLPISKTDGFIVIPE